MKFDLSNEVEVSTESSDQFYGISQQQDAGGLDAPHEGGNTAQVGKGDHVGPNDTYFTPRDFGVKFVNEENKEDKDEDKDDKEAKDEGKKEGDIDDDDDSETSEESLIEHAHLLYAVESTLREVGMDAALESFLLDTGLVDLSAIVSEEDLALEDYGYKPEISAEDMLGATMHSIQQITNTIRDMRAGIL